MPIVLRNCTKCSALWDADELDDIDICPHCLGDRDSYQQSEKIASLISQELREIHKTKESHEMLIARMNLLQEFIKLTLGKAYHLNEADSDEYGYEITQRIKVEEGGIIYAKFSVSPSFTGAKVSYRGSSRPLIIRSEQASELCDYHAMILTEKLHSKFYHRQDKGGI